MRQPRSGWSPFRGALALGWLLTSGLASAQSTAKAHYDRGAEAFASGSYQVAADEFARADELAPNAVALESALKAALLADDVALGMTLADRADGRDSTPGLTAARDAARAAFTGRAGKVSIRCPAGLGCAVKLDGEEIEPGPARWMEAGSYGLTAEVGGDSRVHSIRVEGGRDLDFEVPRPTGEPPAPLPPATSPPPAPPGSAGLDSSPPPDRIEGEDGLSPTWFWVGLGVTVASAGATAGVGAYTLSLHGDFQDGDDSAEDPGRGAQTATNVLLGVTGALAVTTVVVGIAADWSDEPTGPSVSVGFGPGHAAIGGAW